MSSGITNDTIVPLYLDIVIDALTVGNLNVSADHFILPDGEMYKIMTGLYNVLWDDGSNDD